MKINHNKRQGSSIFELLIYIAVISTIGTAISGGIIYLGQGNIKFTSRNEVNSAIRFVLDRIKEDVKVATSVSTPSNGALADCLSATYTSGCLVLGNSGDNTTIVYAVSGGAITRKVCSGGASQLASCSGTTVSLTSAKVSIASASNSAFQFQHLENINPTSGKIIISIKAVIRIAYSTTNTAEQYNAIKRTTFTLGSLFDLPSRGSAGSTGGGGGGGGGTPGHGGNFNNSQNI